MSNKSIAIVATMGIDIGKNSFHVVGLDRRGAIVPRQKWSRGQIEARLAAMPPCLIGMEGCVGAHHLSRKLQALGHDSPRLRTYEDDRGRSGFEPPKWGRALLALGTAACFDPAALGPRQGLRMSMEP